MKTGYDQFFQNARKVADRKVIDLQEKSEKKPKAKMKMTLSEEQVEAQIRSRLKMSTAHKRVKRSKIPWKLVGTSFIGLLVAMWGYENHEQVERIIKRVEIQMTGEAYAETEKQTTPASATPIGASKAEVKVEGEASDAGHQSTAGFNLDHLQKLNERKKELDAREEELNRVEAELQIQRTDLDKRLRELEDMRAKISSILENRVKVDEEKVDTLVQMYSNMRPPQAAKVFETMDEDLAVVILGRMKKKSAADIMNLLKPEKAQVLSEMFAGYKRRVPASEK